MRKTIRKTLFKAAVLVGAAALVSGPALAQKKLVLGLVQSPTSPLAQAAEHFGTIRDEYAAIPDQKDTIYRNF